MPSRIFQPTLNGGNMNFELNGNWMKGRSSLSILAAASFFVMCAAVQAATATLDAKAAKSLISDQTLQIKWQAAGTVAYWSWWSNGTMCAREHEKNSECIDRGTWKLDGDRVCYKLTWLGSTQGFNSHCFRVEDHGAGHYVALSDNGLPFFEFSVAK
jgi:hypothetical protein